MSDLQTFQQFLKDKGIEHFTAEEICRLNTSHDWCDQRYAVPPEEAWERMADGVLAVADIIREVYGGPVLIGDGKGGGGYRPGWYQQGLYEAGISSASHSAHTLATGSDLEPPEGGNRRFANICESAIESVASQSDKTTALAIYGDGHVHLEVATPIDELPGRESRHARW